MAKELTKEELECLEQQKTHAADIFCRLIDTIEGNDQNKQNICAAFTTARSALMDLLPPSSRRDECFTNLRIYRDARMILADQYQLYGVDSRDSIVRNFELIFGIYALSLKSLAHMALEEAVAYDGFSDPK